MPPTTAINTLHSKIAAFHCHRIFSSRSGDSILAKGRESGMPDEDYWSSFFDPECILKKLDCIGPKNVLEFGCGYGNFAIAASRLITKSIYTFDIDPIWSNGRKSWLN